MSGDGSDGSYELYQAIAMTLLKLRLLQCLHDLKHSHMLSSRVPPEIIIIVKLHILQGYGLAGRTDLLKESDYQQRIVGMEGEIAKLFEAVDDRNGLYWELFYTPKIHNPPVIDYEFQERASEATELMNYSWFAWAESKSHIRDLRIIAPAYHIQTSAVRNLKL